MKAGGLCKLLSNTKLFSNLNVINVFLSSSLELYIWVWAISFNIEWLTELCHSNFTVTPSPKWGLSKAANLRQIARAKHGGDRWGGWERGRCSIITCLSSLTKHFLFFPFQVGIDFSQPHGNRFLLIRFLRKALNIYDISPSPYIFIFSCPLLSFVLFCFSPWCYWCISVEHMGVFFVLFLQQISSLFSWCVLCCAFSSECLYFYTPL